MLINKDKKMKQNKDLVIDITGGIGKHIMATSFIRYLNEKYPKRKITVISPYPEFFEYNPRIFRNLPSGQAYLFEDYIKGKDYRKGEPYQRFEYYDEKKHLMEVFPQAYGFNCFNEIPKSEIFLTKGEEAEGEMFCKQNGPLLTFQMCGGLSSGMAIGRMKIDSKQRDLPFKFAVKVAEQLLNKGFKLLQIRNENEPVIPGTIQIKLPFRNLLAISKYSKGHVGIDSSMMHGSAVFEKPQLIFWGQTDKNNLGYDHPGVFNISNEYGMHSRPKVQMPDRKGLFPYKDQGDGLEFEYSDVELNKNINLFSDHLDKKSDNSKKL